MWETSLGQQSLVEYGTTTSLGSSASGNTTIGFGLSQVHDTKIDAYFNTKYYYRVKTLTATSPIYDFVTSNPLNEKSFNIVAMSDMQQNAQHPNVLVKLLIINLSLLSIIGMEMIWLKTWLMFYSWRSCSSPNNYFSWKSSFLILPKNYFITFLYIPLQEIMR